MSSLKPGQWSPVNVEVVGTMPGELAESRPQAQTRQLLLVQDHCMLTPVVLLLGELVLVAAGAGAAEDETLQDPSLRQLGSGLVAAGFPAPRQLSEYTLSFQSVLLPGQGGLGPQGELGRGLLEIVHS